MGHTTCVHPVHVQKQKGFDQKILILHFVSSMKQYLFISDAICKIVTIAREKRNKLCNTYTKPFEQVNIISSEHQFDSHSFNTKYKIYFQ